MAVELGKFQVIEPIGSGHFGNVYRCYDPFLQKERAIKVIKVPKPEEYVLAVKEGQILEHCRHKHIVDVKEVSAVEFQGDLVVIIVMEYLSLGSIQKHIERRFISCKEACRIISQTLLGLEHAHNNNVLHRDIKPGNILFGDNGEAKLSDFGLSIDYHNDPSDLAGYRAHQPLEVIGGAVMDKLSDIYASGITLYRLLNNTNKLAFTFKNRREWQAAVLKNKYPLRQYLPHIPDKIIRILHKSIHNDRTLRYQDCTEFRQSLEKLNFNIDWVKANDDQWIGKDGKGASYEVIKIRKRTGWTIEYRRNGIKKSEFCHTRFGDDVIDAEFYKLIVQNTLA